MRGWRILHWQRRRTPFLGRSGGEHLRLHARNELQLPRTKFSAQETINIERLLGVDAINHCQSVEWDFMPLQLLAGGEDLVKGRLATLVHPEAVVQFLRTIDAQPNQELVVAQKRVPVVIQQSAIGLEVVLDVQTRTLVFLFECDHLLEESDAQQGRFATLPGEYDFVAALGFNVLAYMRL